jgi:hypothetical protein
MHDDDEQIVPGLRIGPFRLGEAEAPLRARLAGADVKEEDRGAVRVIEGHNVSLFVEDGVVTQVGVHGDHPARTSDGLRLGMTLREVRGTLVADLFDEVLLLDGVAGLCFTTDEGLGDIDDETSDEETVLELPGSDRITWIGVYTATDEPTLVAVALT